MSVEFIDENDETLTTEERVETALAAALGEDEVRVLLEQHGVNVIAVQSYGSAGMLTMDKGLVIRCDDGSEWTLTINCYRRPVT
jgi:hypothetical protein